MLETTRENIVQGYSTLKSSGTTSKRKQLH